MPSESVEQIGSLSCTTARSAINGSRDPAIREAQPQLVQWALTLGPIRKPCQWCGDATFSRQMSHRQQACPVLWMIGHLLHRHHTLRDRTQPTLLDSHGKSARAADRGQSGVRPVCGVHGKAGDEHNPSLSTPVHSSERAREANRDGSGPRPPSPDRGRGSSGRSPSTEVGERRGQKRTQAPGGLSGKGLGSAAASTWAPDRRPREREKSPSRPSSGRRRRTSRRRSLRTDGDKSISGSPRAPTGIARE